jgi:Fe2+ transport system protein FeoA
MKTLADLTNHLHEVHRVAGFCGEPEKVERLKEMGIHQGLEVSFIGRAPLKGPLLFRFGNTVLALREEEASCALI